MKISIFKPKWILAVLAIFISVLLIETLIFFNQLQRLENFYSDAWHQLEGKRYDPAHTSIVMVDETSLNKLKDTPLTFWTPYFANIIKILREIGAKVIGIDFLFSANAEQWLRQFEELSDSVRNYDQPIREQIGKGQVVLVAPSHKIEDGYDDIVLPIEDFLYSIPDLSAIYNYLAISDLSVDSDGVYRYFNPIKQLRFQPTAEPEEPIVKYTFATLLSLHAKNFNEAFLKQVENDTNLYPIVFSGPPGTIPRIPFHRLLAFSDNNLPIPKNIINLIKDRIVIIGSDYVGLNDIHTTPYGVRIFDDETRWMSGPEIQANIAESLLSNRKLTFMSPVSRIGISIILFSLACFSFRYLGNTVGITLILFFILAIAYLGYKFFENYVLFPTGTMQMGMLFSFIFIYGLRYFSETLKLRYVESMFGRYVPKKVVSDLVESGNIPKLGGEATNVTILFSDIRNFTPISEILAPGEVVEFINHYLSKAAPCIENNGGNIDKFIGDAIMAEFGAPVKRNDHALCSIKAALELKENSEDFQQWFHRRFPQLESFDFKIGIGINSGNAIMGNIGSEEKTEYTALGDAVNIASRLEGLNKETGWTIVASEATVKSAGDRVIVGNQKEMSVKGRTQAIKVYEILGIKEDNSMKMQ